VIKHSTEVIYLINAAGIITQTAHETDKTLIGKKLISFVYKSHLNRVTGALTEAFGSRKPISCELKARFGRDNMGWFLCRISPILHGDKTPSAIFLASDITERRASYLSSKSKAQGNEEKSKDQWRGVENVLTMCPRTKRVMFRGEWLPIEEFLWKRYGFTIKYELSPGA
jgi:hypothetical protein